MILIAFGTRPEVIKLFPLIEIFKEKKIRFKTLFTGQHIDLFEDVKDLIPEPNFSINFRDKFTLGERYSEICTQTEKFFQFNDFEYVLIQGDTTTSLAISQIAFFNQVKVAHVEAGLRTFDLKSPFPEEFNRVLISTFSDVNFAPTEEAFDNLKKSKAKNIRLVGNTIVDAVRLILQRHNFNDRETNTVLITIHRRENHAVIPHIFKQINELASRLENFSFVMPIHPNPAVKKHQYILTQKNISVIKPLPYFQMLELIANCRFIISDSGGIQEEACCFQKKILIARESTERKETIKSGIGKLIGHDLRKHLDWALDPEIEKFTNPYGDGFAAQKIAAYFEKRSSTSDLD